MLVARCTYSYFEVLDVKDLSRRCGVTARTVLDFKGVCGYQVCRCWVHVLVTVVNLKCLE